jgi:uncharacterized protein
MDIILPDNLIPRELLAEVIDFLDEENIILLTGARQTGKTSLLYLLIQQLWDNDFPKSQTVYFDLENIHDFSLLNDLKDFNIFLELLKKRGVNPAERTYVFIDEIQHLSNPSSFLKYLHDHYKPRLKFIVTGSSSLEIKKKFTDRLTGRVYNFLVKPLNFREFLRFKNEDELYMLLEPFRFSDWLSETRPENKIKKIDRTQRRKLDDLTGEYLIFGGYPAVTLKKKPQIRQKDLQEIYSLYVCRDIRDLGKIGDITGYNRLVSLLALQIGNLVKEQELGLSSGLSRPTIKKYLFLLENTYVLKLVPPFFTNKRKELVKTPKIFFEDIGIRNGVLNNFSDLNQRTDRGEILENYVFNQLSKQKEQPDNIRIWRTQNQNEVDFIWQKNIHEPYPIEVKFKYDSKQPVPPGLKSFLNFYQSERAFVVHLGEFHIRKFKDTIIYAIPAWAI